MTIVGRKMLEDFKIKHADARTQVDAWVSETSVARWLQPIHIKERYRLASFLKDNQIVFNLKGNQYRLLVYVHYEAQVVYIKNVGTHDEYMTW